MKMIYLALILGLLVAIVHSDAALQATAHSTIPSILYANSPAQLQLTITNSGTDTATAVTVLYKTSTQTDYSQTSSGDIGAASSTTISIPFQVPPNANSGFVVMYIELNYKSGTATTTKTTPISIPIEVTQSQSLEVKTTSIDPQVVKPGDKIKVDLSLLNSAGNMKEVTISPAENSGFSLDGGIAQGIGDISINTTKQVSLNLISSSSTPSGKYTIPLVITYRNNIQTTVNQTISIGPVTVSDQSSQVLVELMPLSGAEVGSNSKFQLTVYNSGTSPTSAVIDVAQSSQFTTIGSSHVVFDYIAPGQNITKIINIGVNAGTAAGYYNLPLTITANGKTYTQNNGVEVDATPNVKVTFDAQPQIITSGSTVKGLIQLSNVGNSAIRSLYVAAHSTSDLNIIGTSDKFIGTLNVDDFSTLQVNLIVPGRTAAGKYSLPLDITFKDSNNQVHEFTKNLEVTVYSSGEISSLPTDTGTGTSGMGVRRTGNNGGIFNLGWLTTIALLVVLIVIGYFGYKKMKAKK